MPDTGTVGPIIYSDGNPLASLRLGNYGELVSSQMGGPYYEWTRRGYVFTAQSTAAFTLDNLGTLLQVPILWNKLSQNKVIIPMWLNITPVLATVAVYTGNIVIAAINNAGDAVNASIITALVNQPPVSHVSGRTAYACSAVWSAQATIAASTVINSGKIFSTGMGFITTATVGTNVTWMGSLFHFDFQSAYQLAPGAAMTFALDVAIATAVSCNAYLTFAEIPINPGY
jgi:hypothetical protein